MSQGYLIPCECGQKTTVTQSQAGQEIPCSCGKILQIPKFRDFGNLEKVAPTGPPVVVKTWNPALGALAAIFLLVSIFAFWHGGRYFYTQSQIDTSYTVEDENKAGDESIDQLRPGDIWISYYSFKASGLGRKDPPAFYQALLIRDDMKQYAIKWLVAATVTLVLAFTFIFFSQSKKPAKA